MSKHVKVEDAVHERLTVFGRLGETYSEAIDRALDEAGADGPAETDDG